MLCKSMIHCTSVTSRKVAALLGHNFVGPLNRQPLIHVQAKQSIGTENINGPD
jgi:hypothetical protein